MKNLANRMTVFGTSVLHHMEDAEAGTGYRPRYEPMFTEWWKCICYAGAIFLALWIAYSVVKLS